MNKNIAMATLRLFKAFPKAETVDAKNIEAKPIVKEEKIVQKKQNVNTISWFKENYVVIGLILIAILLIINSYFLQKKSPHRSD